MLQALIKFLVLAGSSSSKPIRSPERQAVVDEQTKTLALYHFDTCPFCLRVRRAINKLQLCIELRNTHREPRWQAELLAGGGKRTVPCLRIEAPGESIHWLYESADIIAYLKGRFAP